MATQQATRFEWLKRWLVRSWLAGCIVGLSACSPASLLISAAGVATDTSVTWEIVKHLHAKMTEGDDLPCRSLDSVTRALNARCGPFVPGSIQLADIKHSPLQGCALTVAASDPRLWAALPELLEKGAKPEICSRSPLVALAQSRSCPEFSAATPEVLTSLRDLAHADSRSINYDVVRMLSCPEAVRAGLDEPLMRWLERGELDYDKVSFGALDAVDPDYLNTLFSIGLERRGHTARNSFGGYAGLQPRGFELALRQSNWAALDWWLERMPELANKVPAAQGNQLPWVPLAKVLAPGFMASPKEQEQAISYLLARGADPWQKLPYDAGKSIVQLARSLKSPMVSLLDPTVVTPTTATVLATGEPLPAP